MSKRKFDIVLTQAEWQKLRPSIKKLQNNKKLSYSAQGYAPGKVLIICHCDDESVETTIDKQLEAILGYVYA